jgi:ABC-type glutathione transport system ATPase component
MMPLLKVERLVTRLHHGPRIVDDISFDIAQGETFALLGESGCGKSMTALSLLRLLPDSVQLASGSVQLAGAELMALPERAMRAVRRSPRRCSCTRGCAERQPKRAVWSCCSRSASRMRRTACTNIRSSCRAA